MPVAKDKAAAALVRKRWNKTTKAERARIARDLNEARNEALTSARRSEIARRAAQARWQKKPKKNPTDQ